MLLKNSIRIAMGTITMAALAACGTKQNVMSDRVDVRGIVAETMAADDKAEELSLAAERLVTPASFMTAYEVAGLALKYDAQNPRARFLRAFLAPSMELRGFMARIVPLMKSHPEHIREYNRIARHIREGDPALVKFFFKGPQDIAWEPDVQEVIARVTLRLDDFRKVLESLKGQEFVLTADIAPFQENGLAKSCRVEQPEPGVFDLSGCNATKIETRKVNTADFEFMRGVISGAQVYLTVLNGYDAIGALKVAGTHDGAKGQDIVEELSRQNGFGALRKNQGFGVLPDVARDVVIGSRYVLAKQSEYCKEGSSSEENRPGYLFDKGVCLENTDHVRSVLGLIKASAAGQAIVITKNDRPFTVNPGGFARKPLNNLRTLLPGKWNECDRLVSLGDNSLGGLLPDSNFDQFVEGDVSCN